MEQRSLLLVHVQSLSRRAYSLGNAFTLALTNLTKRPILTMGKQSNTKKRVAAGHTPAEAAKELAGVAELVESQKAAGLDHTEVVDTIYNSWLNRLRSMHITTGSDQKLLTNALRGDPWSDEQRKQLAHAILRSPDEGHESKKRNNQSCLFLENMIPEDKWLKIRNWKNYSQLSRASMLAAVARSVGIECPDQPTLFRMVSIIAYCEGNWDMPQDKVFELMDNIQQYIKGTRRISGLPYIVQYPSNSDELPMEIQKVAYPDGTLPPNVVIPELDIILGGSRMRGREKETKQSTIGKLASASSCEGSEFSWLKHVPATYKDMFLREIRTQQTQHGGNADTGGLRNHHHARSSDDARPGPYGYEPHMATLGQPPMAPMPSAHLLRMRASTQAAVPRKLEPVPPKKEHDESEEDKEEEEKEEGTDEKEDKGKPRVGTVEAMEAAMLATPKTGKGVFKKPAGVKAAAMDKPSTKKAGVVKKKPAVAQVAVLTDKGMKIAKKINLKDVFKKMRKDRAKLSRNAFCCRAYQTAQRRMLSEGSDASDAFVFARTQHAEASKLWESTAK